MLACGLIQSIAPIETTRGSMTRHVWPHHTFPHRGPHYSHTHLAKHKKRRSRARPMLIIPPSWSDSKREHVRISDRPLYHLAACTKRASTLGRPSPRSYYYCHPTCHRTVATSAISLLEVLEATVAEVRYPQHWLHQIESRWLASTHPPEYG